MLPPSPPKNSNWNHTYAKSWMVKKGMPTIAAAARSEEIVIFPFCFDELFNLLALNVCRSHGLPIKMLLCW